jgi:hypothetical protein
MLMSDAIVVIALDRHARRNLGIGDQRGRAAAFVYVFVFVLVFAPAAVLAPFMPYMS